MAYRINSLERIDGDSLPIPLAPGVARWLAVVEFWGGDAVGLPDMSDDVILQIPTQGMRAVGGDAWELIPPHEYLAAVFDEFLQQQMPNVQQRIAAGERGYRAAHERGNQHGNIKPNDAIAKHAVVRALVGTTKSTRHDAAPDGDRGKP